MNFRDEYKKSAESLSPDRETIDRMKAAVMAQLDEKMPEQPKKKPLPLKRIAYIGGAAAACAIITVSAATFIPMMRNNADMVSEAASAETTASDSTSSMAIANSSVNDTPAFDASDSLSENSIYEQSAVADEFDDDAVDENSDSGTPDNAHEAEITDNPNSGENIHSTAPDISDKSQEPVNEFIPEATMEANEPENAEVTMEVDETGMLEETMEYPSGGTFEIANGTIDESDNSADNPNDDGNPCTGAPDETCESGTFDSCEEFTAEAECVTEEWIYDEVDDTEEAPDYDYRLVLTGKGWLTFKGVRFNQQENAADPDLFEQTLQAFNASDGQFYAVYISDNVLYLYQNDGKFLGAFVKKT